MTTRLAAGILGTGKAVPERILTNADLEKMVDTSDEWIVTRTGIRERRIVDPEIAASDLGYQAALEALKASKVKASELDLIIVATITGDMPFPATACIIQAKLEAPQAAAFDLAAGCSGWVYGLEVAQNMVKAGYKRVLVIGVDILSKITDYSDRSTCVLFGDGAGAAVIGPVTDGFGVLASELGADGLGTELLMLPVGGSRCPSSTASLDDPGRYLKMSGNEVYKFAVRIIGDSTQRVLKKANLTAEDIKWFIPHQANIRIVNAAASRLGIPDERIYINVDRYGNTSAASIPIALDEVARSGKLQEGDLVLVVGFGAGLTWGSAVLRWGGSKL